MSDRRPLFWGGHLRMYRDPFSAPTVGKPWVRLTSRYDEGRGAIMPRPSLSVCWWSCVSLHAGERHGFVELDVRGLVVLIGEAADDDRDEEVDCEAGDDLVDRVRQRSAHLSPDEGHDGTGEQTEQGAPVAQALPEQGEQDNRAERGAKTCPCEGDEVEDAVRR